MLTNVLLLIALARAAPPVHFFGKPSMAPPKKLASMAIKSLAGPRIYAVGERAGLNGEFTVVDGNAYQSYFIGAHHGGESGGTENTVVAGVDWNFEGRATFALWTKVSSWKQVPIPKSVRTLEALAAFARAHASSGGPYTAFLLRATGSNCSWTVKSPVPKPHDVDFSGNSLSFTAIGFACSPSDRLRWPDVERTFRVHMVTAKRNDAGKVTSLQLNDRVRLYLPG